MRTQPPFVERYLTVWIVAAMALGLSLLQNWVIGPVLMFLLAVKLLRGDVPREFRDGSLGARG